MKKITEAFTLAQQKILKNVYIISNHKMLPLIDGNKPTRENLKVIVYNEEKKQLEVLEAHDFEYYSAEDSANNINDYVEDVPEEVAAILECVIKEKMY